MLAILNANLKRVNYKYKVISQKRAKHYRFIPLLAPATSGSDELPAGTVADDESSSQSDGDDNDYDHADSDNQNVAVAQEQQPSVQLEAEGEAVSDAEDGGFGWEPESPEH